MGENKKIKSSKKYSVKFYIYEDGTTSLERVNDGFNAFELLGLTSLIQLEIKEQMAGNIKIDKINRKIITDD